MSNLKINNSKIMKLESLNIFAYSIKARKNCTSVWDFEIWFKFFSKALFLFKLLSSFSVVFARCFCCYCSNLALHLPYCVCDSIRLCFKCSVSPKSHLIEGRDGQAPSRSHLLPQAAGRRHWQAVRQV